METEKFPGDFSGLVRGFHEWQEGLSTRFFASRALMRWEHMGEETLSFTPHFLALILNLIGGPAVYNLGWLCEGDGEAKEVCDAGAEALLGW